MPLKYRAYKKQFGHQLQKLIPMFLTKVKGETKTIESQSYFQKVVRSLFSGKFRPEIQYCCNTILLSIQIHSTGYTRNSFKNPSSKVPKALKYKMFEIYIIYLQTLHIANLLLTYFQTVI